MAPEFTSVAALPVRDSKNPGGPVLLVRRGAWAAFVGSLK
ncbi:DUF397 domain-containing protein [Streptomyces sp. NPDC054770]